MKNVWNPALFAMALSAVAVPVRAADLVTLNVPVEFKNLHPDVASIGFVCTLNARDPLTGQLDQFAAVVQKRVDLKVVNGGVPAQTIKIVFAAEDFKTQDQNKLGWLTGYNCYCGGTLKNGSSFAMVGLNSNVPLGIKPGTPYNVQASGNF